MREELMHLDIHSTHTIPRLPPIPGAGHKDKFNGDCPHRLSQKVSDSLQWLWLEYEASIARFLSLFEDQ